ncbi:hypothetical protein GCM10010293_53670 [Streptomyces griseoflavus]|nr:hypothetical protein GCM10010293_53670 [Streptomyces griseoflavus]
MDCVFGETRQLAGEDCVDPGGERGAEAAGKHLAEIADVSGCRVQIGTAGQDLLPARSSSLSAVG